jgi:hypothetical protein
MSQPARIFYHVGVIVTDLEAAMRELTTAVGLSWSAPVDRYLGDAHNRVTFSREGPPFIELIQGEPGSDWDTSNGPRLDHLGFFSPDLDADKQRLACEGFELAIDGAALSGPWAYHLTKHAGMRLENVDESARGQVLARLGVLDIN